jgi:opacity protein-like surface antigen
MRLGQILAGFLIAGLGQLGLVGSAAADVNKGLYIAADGGVVWTSNQDFGPGAGTQVTYDIGFGAGAQVGYAFGGPRIEFEYNYRYNKADTIGSADGTVAASGHISANSFLVNFLYDFDTGSKWVPYVGVGLGASNVHASNIQPNSPVSAGSFLNGGSTELAGQFIVGVDFMASQHVGLFLDFRGLWVHSANMDFGPCGPAGCGAATGTTSYYYYSGAINAGVKITF